ncbi:MAG: spore germination protein [Eubacteriales bacterium]|nr:spore germination protein [Eubacteriales bacterium]
MQTIFSRNLEKNLKALQERLHLDVNDDVVLRRFDALGQDCALLYVEGLSDGEQMAQHILRPMMNSPLALAGRSAAEQVMQSVLTVPEVESGPEVSQALDDLLRGLCLVLMDTCDQALRIDLRAYARRPVSNPRNETVVVGPHDAFNETLRDNLTLLHRRLPSPNFVCQLRKVGTETPGQAALCYLDGVCPRETVEELQRRLDGVELDYVLTSGTLEQLIEDDPYAPLPQMVGTERPDRVVSFLMEGQAVLLLDGSPRALALPVSLWHLFHAPDDSYMRWQYGTFMRLLRLLGALVTLLLPAVFVSLVVYHPITIPMTLLTSIMQSRTNVPINLFEETLLMVAVFALINESAIRIPGMMGSSLGLVSTLILGTAAVDAGLVSPLLIIVVALSGLGSYAMPNYPLSFAFRMGQVVLLLAAGITGISGLCYAVVMLLCWVAAMESLGQPFLAPGSPRRTHNPDLLLRAPTFRQRLRTYLSNPEEMKRAYGRMRRFDGRNKE